MFITGHVAAAWLGARALARPALARPFGWLLAGSLLPDVLDKSILWAGLSPWGRTVGHSVFVWLALGGVAVLLARWGRPSASLLVIAGWSHLVLDMLNDLLAGVLYSGWVFSLWFSWPLFNPDMGMLPTTPLLDAPARMTPWEVSVVVFCSLWWALERRDRRRKVRDHAQESC